MAKSTEELIAFWKKQYDYVKNQVDRIDAGEDIQPDSIMGMIHGQRAACVQEANIAVDRLAALGNFDLQKIE